jgi:hypothetical protein
MKSLIQVVIALSGLSALAADRAAPANSILVIQPYRYAGTWVFDDARVGLRQEPFVAGVPEILDRMVSDIPDAAKGFRLLFSAHPFPGAQTFEFRRAEIGGSWYYSPTYKLEGWLCPSFFKYFKAAPSRLYVKAEQLAPPGPR